MNSTPGPLGAWRALGLMVLLSGCSAAVPPPPHPVARLRPHPVHHVRHRHRMHHPKPHRTLVEWNRPLVRALERSALPWEAPHFTDVRIVLPSASAAEAGTDAGRETADSVPTIVVHPGPQAVRTAASAGRAMP